MMCKFITTILIILFPIFSFGQKNNIEILINQIYTDVVPENFEYYNLVDSSFTMDFNKYSILPEELTFLKTEYKDFPYEEFIQNNKISSIINWRDYHLEKAKIYSIDSIPKFQTQMQLTQFVPYKINQDKLDSLNRTKKYYEVIVPIKKNWSNKKIEKEIEKAWKARVKYVKVENQIYFRFSTPIIIDNYAIITLNQGHTGASYIYKYIEESWIQIFTFRRWII